MGRSDVAHQDQAVVVSEREIGDHQVRLRAGDRRECLVVRGRGGADDDIGLVVDERAQAATHEEVIVDDHDAPSRRRCRPGVLAVQG